MEVSLYTELRHKIDNEYVKKLHDLDVAYVRSIIKVKVGDVVKDHKNTIRVEKIIVPVRGTSSFVTPTWYYRGPKLTTTGKPFKDQRQWYAYDNDIREVNGICTQ